MVDNKQGTDQASTMEADELPGIIGYVTRKYDESKTSRQTHESRWLRAYKKL